MTKKVHKNLQNPIEQHFKFVSPYHYYFFFFVFLSKLPVFWHVLNLIFLSPPMTYYCNETYTEINNTVASNKNVCPCDEPKWDHSVFTKTIQTKFHLYCDSTWLISFSQSMHYVGLLIGSLLFGFLSDRYGRLCTFTISCFTLALAGCLVAVMPTPATFIFMRSIEGIGAGGAIVTAYVLCIEYCSVNHREVITALFHIPINLGHMTLAGVSYMLRDYDDFQLAISIPMFLFVAFYWMMMESPKWLMDSERIEEAALVMEKICQFNKTPCESIKEKMEAYQRQEVQKNHRKLKFWHIFEHRKLSLNFACMSFIYFVCGMGYYGVSQYIGQMSGDIHVNVAISGALILPGTLACVFLLKILGRRPFLMATTLISGLLMIVVIIIPEHMTWERVLIACICNCFFFMAFIIVFLYGVELFPTSIRNSVLGCLSFLSRVGQIIAPPINALPEITSGTVFGTMAILGAFLCYPLPETKDTELPSTLEQTKSLSRKKLQSRNDNFENAETSRMNQEPGNKI